LPERDLLTQRGEDLVAVLLSQILEGDATGDVVAEFGQAIRPAQASDLVLGAIGFNKEDIGLGSVV